MTIVDWPIPDDDSEEEEEEPADIIDRVFDIDLPIRDVYIESGFRTRLVRR